MLGILEGRIGLPIPKTQETESLPEGQQRAPRTIVANGHPKDIQDDFEYQQIPVLHGGNHILSRRNQETITQPTAVAQHVI
jgi:hypothetical protein